MILTKVHNLQFIMANSQYILGIDIGTGSTKAAAVDLQGNVLNIAQHYYAVKTPQPGYSEQDPAVIRAAFLSCIADSVISVGQPLAISISCAMHSVIPVNQHGKALANMMTWADARSEDIAEKLRQTDLGKQIYRTSGTPIHAMTPLCKIMWLRDNEQELFDKTYKFVSIKEYIWHHLFGDFQIDHSIASATGLFDIKTLKWNEEACKLAGIAKEKLSVPVSTTYKRNDIKSSVASKLGLNADVSFVIGSSDGCCANLGSYLEPEMASLTIGTSGAVRITSKQPVVNDEAMIFNYIIDDDSFACGGAINNGGIVLNWLLHNFMDVKRPGHNDYEELFKRIDSISAGSEGLIFLPYLYGERAPIWDTKSCGLFFNIKQQHTREHFLRAGLEGICLALNNVLTTLESTSGAINKVHISGGFTTSAVWTQMLADITGKELIIMQEGDASAIGAVLLSLKALDMEVFAAPEYDEQKSIVPQDENHKIYDNSFRLFKGLYHDLRDTMHWVHEQG
jgi:gluconokinase